ncbi:MAG: hypothetical protein QOE73_2479 [Verrucomicrobiota bacterium]
MARADEAKAINSLIAEIDSAVKANKPHMLSLITINTDVAGTTLEQEKSRTGFSYGEVYVAHSIALASHKTFDQIAAVKAKGSSWAQIAQMNKVRLRGSAALLKEMREKKKDQ